MAESSKKNPQAVGKFEDSEIFCCRNPMSDLANQITKIGISEYDLEKLYPTKVEGMIPTIEEIEDKLSDRLSGGSNAKDCIFQHSYIAKSCRKYVI